MLAVVPGSQAVERLISEEAEYKCSRYSKSWGGRNP